MTDAAVIAAQVVDIQNDRQHKGSIKVTLHVPAELGHHLTEVLGWPTYTNPVPVALARLNKESIAQQPPPSAPNADKEGERKLYARIGTLCKDPKFGEYVSVHTGMASIDGEKDAAAYVRAAYVRDFCQVASRRHIVPGSIAEELFLRLEDDFEMWRTANFWRGVTSAQR